MGKDIDGLIQRAISKCIDDGEYDPVEDWIVDPSLRLCNEALGEAAAEIETLRTQLATAVKKHDEARADYENLNEKYGVNIRGAIEYATESKAHIAKITRELATANAETARLGRELKEARARADRAERFITTLSRVAYYRKDGDEFVVPKIWLNLPAFALRMRDGSGKGGAEMMDLLGKAIDATNHTTGGASDALRAQADAPTKEGAD